jgi:hypothetical protein
MKIKMIVLVSLTLLATMPVQEAPPSWALSDEITFGDQEQIQGASTKGEFEPVTLDPLATIDVKLQFPTALAGAPVIVQALDGGVLSGIDESATLDGEGAISFQFHVSDQPRLYRILATVNGSSVGMVQFEVPNPPE